MESMIEVSAARLETLATEIRTIQENTKRIMLTSTIAIGERLAEAKAAVGHGGWLDWLKNNTDFKERHAQKAIRLWQEYGQGQQVLIGKTLKEEDLLELTSTQAEILLGIKDRDERIEFIEENNLSEMTTRELQEAVKAKENAEKSLEQEKKALADARAQIREREKEADRFRERSIKLEEEIGKLEAERDGALSADFAKESEERIRTLENELKESRERAEDLKKEVEDLKSAPVEVATIEKIPDDVQRELDELRARKGAPLMAQFKAHLITVRDQVAAMMELGSRMTGEEQAIAIHALGKVADNIKAKAATIGEEEIPF